MRYFTLHERMAEFVLKRLAEDEALAMEFIGCDWAGSDAWGDGAGLFNNPNAPASAERVLGTVESLRTVVEQHAVDGDDCYWTYADMDGPCPTLTALAAIYVDHPDHPLRTLVQDADIQGDLL